MKYTTLIALTAALALGALAARAAEDEKKADDYPLTTCVVSGETLGEMGKPVSFMYEGREVRFCCKDCKRDFLKDPKKYLAKIDEAAKAKAEGKSPASEGGETESHEHHHGDME